MKTESNVLETILDELGVLVIGEIEAMETAGGSHLEYVNGILTLVQD